ncbi:CHAP domain-containing protein [Salinicoccus sp. ID82-1]|uniref:CHAP domain-containing protein n=1 Tax=Salinicoccus cyprini TaxID=2493691 RepID=A0A558AV04_9STAP|nr:CHAP domain-containing protein [Salinicoccus cyprini]MCG1010538.1 CHAP domain-containing protein [Salinicoccus sp. ID82-1]TVT28094.1 CHAP domain-containing protein [Salinicoccus cyprini]
MKKLIVFLFIIILITTGLFIVDRQTERGLIGTLEYTLLPDPMATNFYDAGECTFYVFNKVKANGEMIETSWRNAEFWAARAKTDGYTVNDEPAEGAILQTSRGEIGHVAYIETVNEDGSIDISEMNYREPYEVTERTITADRIDEYAYIHPKVNPRPKEMKAQTQNSA